METLNYKNFFLESSLYAPIEITSENMLEVLNILYYNQTSLNRSRTLDTICIDCNENKTMLSSETFPPEDISNKIFNFYNFYNLTSDQKEIEEEEKEREKEYNQTLKKLEGITFFKRTFSCPKEPYMNSHKLIFFLKIENGKLSKIGQSQSVASLQKNDIKGLQELNKKIYKEYNSAIGLASHGIGIGAFVYLRRIIEKHIIIPEGEKMITSGQITKEDFERMRFAEKIKTVKNNIPDFLVENKSIYGILSKGIHELTEKECKTYFPVVKSAIDIILKDLITKKEEEKSRNQLKIKLEELAAQ